MGLILSLDNSIHSFNRAGFVGLLDQYTGAAAGYSLRRLSVNTTNVVRVRRSSDNAEADFTADEITDGTLLAWVNTDVVKRDDDYSLSDTWSEIGGTGAFNQSIGGRSGLYQYTYSGGATTHQAFQASNHPDNSLQYKITFDIYFDVAQDCNGFSYLKPDGTSDTQDNLTKGVWHSFTYTTLGGSNLSRFIPSVNGASSTNNDGSGFYLSSFVVEQLTADGFVTTWYDQSGNSKDATQGIAASQPKIVDAGSLITSNGYQVIQYDGTDDNLTTSLTATGTMLMGGSDGGAFYEVDISGSYSLLANASTTDHPLNESIRVIWSSSLTTAQKTAIESLITYTDWDFSDVTIFTRYWRNRSEITDFPLLDVSNGINFSFAWQGCTSLTSFKILDVSSGTNFSNAWQGCSSLSSFPALDVSSGTNFFYAWLGCSSLTSFPLLDVSNGTNFYFAWRQCSSLQDFPANMFDSVTATNFTNAFENTNLSSQSIENIVVSIDTAGQSNGTLNITGGGNATTATAQTAIDNLRGRGWTVTVPDGY